jgi:hypothetical protein
MSNIRRQVQQEKDPYLEEPFMKHGVFRSDDEEEAVQSFRPMPRVPEEDTTGDPLWDNYGIKPSSKLEDKIEILVVNFGKTASEVAAILELGLKEVDNHVAELESRLRDMGRSLDGEDKELQRGIAIRKMQILIQDLRKERVVNTDIKLLTAQLTAERELNALLELATDKKKDKEVGAVDAFDAALSKLPAEATLALHTFLKERYS